MRLYGFGAWLGSVLGLLLAGCSGENPGGSDGGGGGDEGTTADAGSGVDSGAVDPPGTFTLTSPSDGDYRVTTTPALAWSPSSGAVSYNVEVATSTTFETIVSQVTGVTSTSATLTTAIAPGAIHYWRVTAVNAGGSTVASNAPFWMSTPVAVGSNPHGVAVTPDGTQAIVANDVTAGSLTFVALPAFTTQTVTVGGYPKQVSITPDGALAIVTELNDAKIVDIATKSVARTVTPPCVATTLYGVAAAPGSETALMPDFDGGCIGDVLDVINLATGAITTAIDLGSSATAFGVAVTPDGATGLVTRGITTTSVRRVNLGTSAYSIITGTSSSYGAAVTPDGLTALVTSGPSDTVKVISLTSNTVTASIPFESNDDVGNVAITADGLHAVVVGSFYVGVITLGTNTVKSHSGGGTSVAVTPDGTRALVTSSDGNLYVLKIP